MDLPTQGRAELATVRVRSVASILEVLTEWGFDPSHILRAAALDQICFPIWRTSFRTGRSAGSSGKPPLRPVREGFGLRVGSKLGAESVGLPGLVSLHASTVREALQVIVEGLRTRDTGGRVSLDVRDDTASFRFVVVAPNVEAADQIADGALAICFNLMKGLCGAGWRPEKVRLVRDAPRDPVPFNWFFEASIEHSAACAALCSPQPRWMSVRVSTGPPTRKS